METISKSVPCPCGSGLKYKRCCFKKEELQKKEKKRHQLKILLILVLVLFGIIVSYQIHLIVRPAAYDKLTKCLTNKGYVLYGAYWCPNSVRQKEIFGESIKRIKYVDCSLRGTRRLTEFCRIEKGIKKIPTWITSDGHQIVGYHTLEELADISNCPF